MRRRVKDKKKIHLYLICDSSHAESRIQYIQENEIGVTRLCGVILTDEDRVGEQILGIDVVSDLKNAHEYARTHVVDEVLIDVVDFGESDFVEGFQLMGITVHICIESIVPIHKGIVGHVDGIPVISASINEITPRQLFIKRLIDVCGAIIGCVMTLVFMIIFGPIIYIQSPGPIFFVQKRVGKNGRTFPMIKFRSMYMDAEKQKAKLQESNEMTGVMFKMKNDPRIIPIGRFMRKTSIDEFPQFINVLKGDMSLVGTRPPTVDEYEQYEIKHMSRLAIKPGLTGMWQVSGRSNIHNFEDVVKLDNEYIKNWSFSLDLKILLKTIEVVLKGEGSC